MYVDFFLHNLWVLLNEVKFLTKVQSQNPLDY